jgi:hypothetical protein
MPWYIDASCNDQQRERPRPGIIAAEIIAGRAQ